MRFSWQRLLLVIVVVSVVVVWNNTRTSTNLDLDRRDVIPSKGELRAAKVWERCRNVKNSTCFYRYKNPLKRFFMLPEKLLMMCSLGKTASSNWKVLFLQVMGNLSNDEVEELVYPHSAKYWVNKTLSNRFKVGSDTDKTHVLTQRQKTIQEFYKITFVRDPLSRLFSAYRDKYTGDNLNAWFQLYMGIRAKIICFSLRRFAGSDVPLEEELKEFIRLELSRNCINESYKVSIGMLILFILFIPPDYATTEFRADFAIQYPGDKLASEFQETIINTHYSTMLSMCGHCSMRYDYIGTVETMSEDSAILREKFGINYSFPRVASTSKGAATTSEVRREYEKLPELLKQYIRQYYATDAYLFGYEGYDSHNVHNLNLALLDKTSKLDCKNYFYMV